MSLCRGCGCPEAVGKPYCPECLPELGQWTPCFNCNNPCPLKYCSVCFLEHKHPVDKVKCSTSGCKSFIPKANQDVRFSGGDCSMCFTCQRQQNWKWCELCEVKCPGKYCKSCYGVVKAGSNCQSCGSQCNYFQLECKPCYENHLRCACGRIIRHDKGDQCTPCFQASSQTFPKCANKGCDNTSKLRFCRDCYQTYNNKH
jgi:hypothetical protein